MRRPSFLRTTLYPRDAVGRRAVVLIAGVPRAGIRRLLWAAAGLIVITLVGVLGYHFISGFSLFDALYQVVLTMTTVGFQEVHPLGRAGRVFTIVLAIVGVTTGLYLMAAVAATLLEGQLYRDLRGWRMTRELESLRGHVIVAGAGRVGRGVADELERRRRAFVVIDHNLNQIELQQQSGRLAIHGDASQRDSLLQARLADARALVVATGNDAQNTFITLTALGIDPACYVVARCNDPESAAPLQQAGAARVLTPTQIVGHRLAAASLHPAITEFAENVLQLPGAPDVLIRLDVFANSAAAGSTAAAALAQTDSAQLLGVRTAGGEFRAGSSAEQPLGIGDAVLVLVAPQDVDALEEQWSGSPDT